MGFRTRCATRRPVTIRTPTGHEHHSRPPDLPHEPRFEPFTVDFRYSGSAA